MVPPVYLLATKLEAFASRGRDDPYASKDFEDLIRLVDGRQALAAELGRLSRLEDFDSAAEGALGGGPETLDRFEQVLRPRIRILIGS